MRKAKFETQRIKSQEPAADANGATPLVRGKFCRLKSEHDERVLGLRVGSGIFRGFSNLRIGRPNLRISGSQEPEADADGATPMVREKFCKAETGHDERVPGMRVSSRVLSKDSQI